jgi:hypothetical protein
MFDKYPAIYYLAETENDEGKKDETSNDAQEINPPRGRALGHLTGEHVGSDSVRLKGKLT